MNCLDLIKLKNAFQNFLEDKLTTDDTLIMIKYGYIISNKTGNELNIIYPSKQDIRNVLNEIKIRLGE